MNASQIKRIIVRAPNWVGDAVMSLSALRELRNLFPGAHLTLASPSGTADIFNDVDFVDEILIPERAARFTVFAQARQWRKHRFDLAVIFQNSFAGALVPFLARVPLRVGYATERRGALLTHALLVPEWKNQRHESSYYLNIVAELERILAGTSNVTQAQPRFNLNISEYRKRQVRELLSEHGAILTQPLVILAPGSINSRAKRWPPERYAALSDRLIESDMTVVLIGSTGELEVSDEVCRYARSRPIVLTGKTTVAEAVALIGIADLLISNDTGPAHIGAAVGTPTVAIFGPTNPLTTYPLSPNAEIIRHPPDCAPCMLRDCPIDHRCMTAITSDEVFERASAVLHTHQCQPV